MAVAKKAVAKKAAARKAAPRKSAANKAAAKKTIALGGSTAAMASEEMEFSVDDVVLLTDDTSGGGRVCRVLNFGRYCVNFADVGCRRVSGASLRLAPAGTSAPNCASCTDC